VICRGPAEQVPTNSKTGPPKGKTPRGGSGGRNERVRKRGGRSTDWGPVKTKKLTQNPGGINWGRGVNSKHRLERRLLGRVNGSTNPTTLHGRGRKSKTESAVKKRGP